MTNFAWAKMTSSISTAIIGLSILILLYKLQRSFVHSALGFVRDRLQELVKLVTLGLVTDGQVAADARGDFPAAYLLFAENNSIRYFPDFATPYLLADRLITVVDASP